MTKSPTLKGMGIFIVIWLGQLVSLMGSNLTAFAMGIWVYQSTGSVTQLALINLAKEVPTILVSPLAGTLVDRWNRRWTMILSDSGAGLSTVVIALLLITGRLEIWHIYIANIISSIFSAFQWPAYNAAMTQLVPKQQLGRGSGMIRLGQSFAHLISPLLGGVLLVAIQLQGVILIDFITFFLALISLLCVRLPSLKIPTTGKKEKSSLWREATYGWNYITTRPGLLGLLMFFAFSNFTLGVVSLLVQPLGLSFTSADVLGMIMSIGGMGMLIGSLLITIRGEPKQLMKNIFGFHLLIGLCLLLVGCSTFLPLLAVAAFIFFFSAAITQSCGQVIWQRKVPANVQGRVFAIKQMIVVASFALARFMAGPLADFIFEPLMNPNSILAGSLGKIIGVGEGRGIGLMFVVMGIITFLVTSIAYQYPKLRLVEKQLPDAVLE